MPPSDPNDLSPQAVIAWLKSHPDFLEQHPDACDFLTPPKEKKAGGIVDFQQYLVKRLKEDREQVLTTAHGIMETARSNMNNTTRIHRAILRLLECQSFTEFIETITADLATQLDVDICTLVVEGARGDIPHIHVAGIRMVPEGTIDGWLTGKLVLLQAGISGVEPIYGGGATLVRSQCLVRVEIALGTPPALLAFGSRDPALFTDGQGTELILFLTHVVERLFRSWLQLPLR